MENERQFFGAQGHLTDEGVALFVDALKLDTVAQLPRTMRDHVAGCERCMTSVTELLRLLRHEDYSSVTTHPSFRLRDRRTSSLPVWRAAAAVAAVLIVSAMVYLLVLRGAGERQQGPTHTTTVGSGDSAAAPASASSRGDSALHSALAANFTPNPEYEELVNSGIRSSTFKASQPPIGALVSANEVRFSWDAGSRTNLKLVIVNVRGEDVETALVTRLPYRPAKALTPGLYYWKVVDREEALYFGKFSVREKDQLPMRTNPAQK